MMVTILVPSNPLRRLRRKRTNLGWQVSYKNSWPALGRSIRKQKRDPFPMGPFLFFVAVQLFERFGD
jgi:hypothetical protein